MHLTDTLAYTYSMGLHFVDIFQQWYHLHLYLIVKLSDGLKDFILLQLFFMSQLIVLNVFHEFALLGFLLELLQTSEMVFYEILSHRNDLLALSLDELVVNTLQVVQHKSFVLKLLLLGWFLLFFNLLFLLVLDQLIVHHILHFRKASFLLLFLWSLVLVPYFFLAHLFL